MGTAWLLPQPGHSVGTPTAIALRLALPLLRLLDLHLPVAGTEHGTVLVLVVISPIATWHLLLTEQGGVQEGGTMPNTLVRRHDSWGSGSK